MKKVAGSGVLIKISWALSKFFRETARNFFFGKFHQLFFERESIDRLAGFTRGRLSQEENGGHTG